MSDNPLPLRDDVLPRLAERGIAVPEYDRSSLRPRIVHVGVGGFHRAHLALYTDRVAAQGGDWGIVGLGLLDHDARIGDALDAQDHLYTLVERGSDGQTVRVVGSLIGFVHAPPGGDDSAVAELLASPETAILSLTVTEAGYAEPSPEQVAGGASTFDRLAAALAERRRREGGPLTVLSCDNLPGNGRAAHRSMVAAARRQGGEELAAWVEGHCSFPDSMVDRIAPATSPDDARWLRETHGVEDRWPVVCEPFRQWVVQDRFPAGRPEWERDGALFTDDVHAWELYKLRLLNASHSVLAYLCSLAGITHVDEAMATPGVAGFLHAFLEQEAAPTLEEIPGHPPADYVTVLEERLTNTGVRDQVARLCVDGTSKMPTFVVPTAEAQLEAGGPVARAATALAGWARYLGAGAEDELAHDTRLATTLPHARAALDDPAAFLELTEVFTPSLRESARFRETFVAAYRTIAEDGPLTAMRTADELDRG